MNERANELAAEIVKGLKTVVLDAQKNHCPIRTADGEMIGWAESRRFVMPPRYKDQAPEGSEPNGKGRLVLVINGGDDHVELVAEARKAVRAAVATHARAVDEAEHDAAAAAVVKKAVASAQKLSEQHADDANRQPKRKAAKESA